MKDLGELLETHFSSKFDLLSVEDRFDTSTAAGRLALNMMASISQWEREVIGERTSAALQHKKAQGQHVGCAGLGYQMIEGALREDAEEQEVLERITEMKGEGLTLRAMAERLTEEGHKPKRGDRWHVSSLSRYCKKLGA